MTPPKADPLAERIAARVAKLQHGPSYVGYESSHLRRANHYAAEARAYFGPLEAMLQRVVALAERWDDDYTDDDDGALYRKLAAELIDAITG